MTQNCYRCLYHESFRCRNKSACPDGMQYVEYTGSTVRQCLEATTEIYQDGYIHCPIIDSIGCVECEKRFGDGSNWEYEEDQNYERKPRWLEEAKEVAEQKTCPYFNGICQEGRKPQIKCGNDILSYFGESKEERDRHISEICRGQMDNCRAYLCRRLKEAGAGPRSDHSTDELREIYIKVIGSEAMPKQTYWTKCGRQFEKNSTATVTGYELPFNEDESHVDGITQEMAEWFEKCISCPFRNKVEDGWPEKKFVRWECRAGSMEPNHKTEWRGSLDDKNTIQIYSLDHQLMEEIIAFCKDHPDLGASYNADSQADCRRTVSICCSSNKKGIAAKKALIEKFFPDQLPQIKSCRTCANSEIFKNVNHAGSHGNCHKNGGSYPIYIPGSKCEDFASASEDKDVCGDCGQFTLDTDDANGYGHCDYKNRRMAKDHEACVEFEQSVCPKCETDNCPFNDREGACLFTAERPESEGYLEDLARAVEEHGCQNLTITNAYEKLSSEEEMKEVEDMHLDDDKKCKSKNEQCGYYCAHNGGCSLLIVGSSVLKDVLDGIKTRDEACGVYRQTLDKFYPKQMEEVINALDTPASNTVQPFDYSTVDADTATFLQEKANRITEIRIKSVVAIGKELKEAQDRLSSHNKYEGVFCKWTESMGLKKSSAYNYIQAYGYVVQNLDNIEDAEKIQPSLLFAISKPSAPAELQQAVLAGDITSHKQYKELEEKLKAAEDRLERTERLKSEAVDKAIKAEQEMKKAQKLRDDSLRAYEKDLFNLHQQLEQAKRNGDPKKVQELGEKIRGYQDEIENYQHQIGSLNAQLAETKKQLKDRPIEVAATKTVEVIPEEIKDAIYRKVASSYEGLNGLSLAEIRIFAAGVDPDHRSDVIDDIQNAISILSVIEREIYNANYAAAAVEEAAATSEPAGYCGDCALADMDGVTDEQLDDGKTLCTATGKVVDFDHTCDKYKRVGR